MEQTLNTIEEEPAGSLAYPWYIVSLCMLAYIFSFIDRQVISLLIDPIRADLINELIIKLQHTLGTTAIVVTHDMASARFYF